VSLELDRWHVVEGLVNSSVVEPVDVVERRPFDVFDVAPRSLAVDQLGLVETVERFGQSIVIGVTLRSNGRDDLGLAETFRVTNAEVLNAAVRVKPNSV
jgi:hypothetical protein